MSEKVRHRRNRKVRNSGNPQFLLGEKKLLTIPLLTKFDYKPRKQTIEKNKQQERIKKAENEQQERIKKAERRILKELLLEDIRRKTENNEGPTSIDTNPSNGFLVPSEAPSSSKQLRQFLGLNSLEEVCVLSGIKLEKEKEAGSNIPEILRSCGDTYLLNLNVLMEKICDLCRAKSMKPEKDVAKLISHAVEERLKNIVESALFFAQMKQTEIQTQASDEPEMPQILRLEDLQEFMRRDPILKHGKILFTSHIM